MGKFRITGVYNSDGSPRYFETKEQADKFWEESGNKKRCIEEPIEY